MDNEASDGDVVAGQGDVDAQAEDDVLEGVVDAQNEADDSELSDATEEETQQTPFVRKPGRGCEHYSRGCRLVSPCCGEQFWCRFCHNAAMDTGNSRTGHTLDRHAVKAVNYHPFLSNQMRIVATQNDFISGEQVVCGECGLKQPVSQFCIADGCGNKFGEYFCKICNFFDDEISKKPFHCDGCGICR